MKYSISALHSSKRNHFLLESKELDQWLLSQKRLQCQMYFGSCIPSPLEQEGEGTRGTQEEICLHSQECKTKKKIRGKFSLRQSAVLAVHGFPLVILGMGEDERRETSVIILSGASRCTVLIIKEESPN